MDARAIIAKLRDRVRLSREELDWFASGLANGAISDAQAGAFAMAVVLNGLREDERIGLTLAMRDSGRVLDWALDAPVVDKHSTGGIGDCVSLLLAPMLAAAGLYVPMISGRGLGHTGGTLDKLESIPGVSAELDEAAFRRVVGEVGCAIVAAGRDLAPADRRLYAVRDVTATVNSRDLIAASILSKKLAAGVASLVLDVKVGSGAFMATLAQARDLAGALVATASDAGCPTTALITDMSQPLAASAGNAVEVAEVMGALTGSQAAPRLVGLASDLGGELLAATGMAPDRDAGAQGLLAVLEDGRAAEKFGQMVAAMGGPADFVDRWPGHLSAAPIAVEVAAAEAGFVTAIDGRALGMVVVRLGGGRRRASDPIDHSVGLSHIVRLGERVEAGQPIARVHAADAAAVPGAVEAVARAIAIDRAPVDPPPLIVERVA